MFYVKTHLLTLSTEKDDFDFCEETANLIKKSTGYQLVLVDTDLSLSCFVTPRPVPPYNCYQGGGSSQLDAGSPGSTVSKSLENEI